MLTLNKGGFPMELKIFLQLAVQMQASDLHLKAGSPPVLRINGQIEALDYPVLTSAETRFVARKILGIEKYELFEKQGEMEGSFYQDDVGNFRISVYQEKSGVGLAFRVVSTLIPNIHSLNLPIGLKSLLELNHGLILVTGPTGSGKTTSQAAMIDYINEQRSCHIITLEDPIEYIHSNKKSIITQREIGTDSRSFPAALKAALRQDPDIIMIGEMRDLETISIALTAAETGHLVLATLHTTTAAQSISRIIDVFPSLQQRQAQVMLSNSITGVISQRLIPSSSGKSRYLAAELMVATPAIRNLIREGKLNQIYSSIQTGGKMGMQTMEISLQQLVAQGVIDEHYALEGYNY
jgi:twitching motility protein PilT